MAEINEDKKKYISLTNIKSRAEAKKYFIVLNVFFIISSIAYILYCVLSYKFPIYLMPEIFKEKGFLLSLFITNGPILILVVVMVFFTIYASKVIKAEKISNTYAIFCFFLAPISWIWFYPRIMSPLKIILGEEEILSRKFIQQQTIKDKKTKSNFWLKFIIIFCFIFLFFLALTWYLSHFNSPSKRNQNNNATQCASGLNDPRFKVEGLEEASTSSVQETCPSPQELNGDICKTLVFTKPLKSEIIFNNEIKKDKYVKYLRKAIDNFLSDEYILNEAYENLVKIDPVYLKGKFIIISIDDSMFGGKDILLISKNKPDKIFLAWVYGNGENEPLTLRNFEEVDGPPCISDIQKVVINQLCNDAFGF